MLVCREQELLSDAEGTLLDYSGNYIEEFAET